MNLQYLSFAYLLLLHTYFWKGLCYAATAVGVASGFFAGGQFMQKWFVDFDRVDMDR